MTNTHKPPATGHSSSIGRSLLAPVIVLRAHSYLIWALTKREIEGRVRGTVLGLVWLLIGPLFMLSIYTLVFGLILDSRWQDKTDKAFLFPLVYFSGLIVFNFFFDSVSRAPNLMRDNQAFIKKIVFPVEVFAYALAGSALIRLGVGLVLLAVFQFALIGPLPPTALVYPVLLCGLMFHALGVTLALAGLAVFFRDISHMMQPLSTVLMFLSPIFYPLSSVPAALQPLVLLNPLAYPLEATRNALFFGQWPSAVGVVLYCVIGWLVAIAGHRLFMSLRPGFADVI